MKIIRKQVILALLSMAPSLVLARPAGFSDIESVFIEGNTDNDYASDPTNAIQTEGIFISSNGAPAPYINPIDRKFNGEYSNVNSVTPFAGGYYVGSNDDSSSSLLSPGNTTSTSAFSGNFANRRDASGNFLGRDASGSLVVGSDSSGNFIYTPVSGHASSAQYDASGNLNFTSATSGNLTPQGDTASGSFSAAAYNDDHELAFAVSGSVATNYNNSAYSLSAQIATQEGYAANLNGVANTEAGASSFSTQIVGPNGYAANVSGVVNAQAGSGAATIALTGPGGNALLANLTGSLATNTISGTISGAGGGPVDASGNSGIFGSEVAGGVITGSVTLGNVITDGSGNVIRVLAAPSASASVYTTNVDGSASQTSIVTNGIYGSSGQSMNVDASGNASIVTGVTTVSGLSAGSSATANQSGISTYSGVKNYNNSNFAGVSSYQDASGNNQTTSIGLIDDTGFRGLSVNSSGTYINGGANNGGMYFDSNGVTVGKVDASGNIVNTSQIHGVTAGTAATDAVNVSQLNSGINSLSQQINGMKGGIASTVAMANIPQVDQGKHYSIGMGLGHYDGASAVSVGGSIRVNESAIIKGTVGRSFSNSGPADSSTTVGVGAAFSW